MAERGVSFTVGVEALFSPHIQAIARAIPSEQLLTETDNPDGLQWLTGVLGMPARIREVVLMLAELRNTSSEDIIRTVQENLARLFRGGSVALRGVYQVLDGRTLRIQATQD
jgi:Tat protein secretion system quality control protein TatD with DNase activity